MATKFSETVLSEKILELQQFIQTAKFHSLPEEKKEEILQTLNNRTQKLVKEKALAPLRALRRAEQERIDKIRSEEVEKQLQISLQIKTERQTHTHKVKTEVERKLIGFTFYGMESFKVKPNEWDTTGCRGCIVFTCWDEPAFTFELLEDISKRLETRKLNFGNETTVTNGGCESCQHGREWEFSVSFSCDHQL